MVVWVKGRGWGEGGGEEEWGNRAGGRAGGRIGGRVGGHKGGQLTFGGGAPPPSPLPCASRDERRSARLEMKQREGNTTIDYWRRRSRRRGPGGPPPPGARLPVTPPALSPDGACALRASQPREASLKFLKTLIKKDG